MLAFGRNAVADFVAARRIRRRVIEICNLLLSTGITVATQESAAADEFWVRATLIEAQVGLEQPIDEELTTLKATATQPWMIDAATTQFSQLRQLIERSPLRTIDSSMQNRWEAARAH